MPRDEPEDPRVMTRAKALRLVRGLRSSEVAVAVGIERTDMSRIERGEPDSRRRLTRLANFYGVRVDTMMDRVRLRITK